MKKSNVMTKMRWMGFASQLFFPGWIFAAATQQIGTFSLSF